MNGKWRISRPKHLGEKKISQNKRSLSIIWDKEHEQQLSLTQKIQSSCRCKKNKSVQSIDRALTIVHIHNRLKTCLNLSPGRITDCCKWDSCEFCFRPRCFTFEYASMCVCALTLRVQQSGKTQMLLCQVKGVLEIVVSVGFLQFIKINQVWSETRRKWRTRLYRKNQGRHNYFIFYQ